ncbi:MAG: hypothetical protein A2Z20_09700 [Bdellovibrionales bacterium RBG_16_40_8]|nr:MAG: hypothetical protein A2Z20_09700 [Bdellovibrionales bacterium RBG_16_40_8]
MKQNIPDNVFKSAVEATSTGVLVTDYQQKDNPIVYVNPFFQNLTGYKEEEIIGKNCRFLQGPETDKQVVANIRNAIKSQNNFRGEVLNYRKNGSTFLELFND